MTVSAPATTCALDITRFGATTKPVPSKTFWQPGATPRILSTLGRTAATTGSLISAASGASTLTIGVRPKLPSTSGSPEVSSSALSRLGTAFSHGGATSSTWLSTFEPRTAAARFGWLVDVSGVASR